MILKAVKQNWLRLVCFLVLLLVMWVSNKNAFIFQRRLTWCPGAALSKAPLASAAAVQARLQRISSSPSSEESEFDEMAKDAFFSSLNREEERRSNEFSRRRVGFVSPQAARFVHLFIHWVFFVCVCSQFMFVSFCAGNHFGCALCQTLSRRSLLVH